jgi:uncharacterized RDD family membrane protein YckC
MSKSAGQTRNKLSLFTPGMPELKTQTTFPRATLLRRLMAMVYDTFLVIPSLMLFAAIYTFIKVKLLGIEHIENSPTAAGDPVMFAGLIITLFGFFVFFWVRYGHTLGMQTWRMKIQQADGTNITVTQGIVRVLFAIIGLLPAGIGYLMCLLKDRRTLSDRISGTEIIVLPKKDSKKKKN